HGVPDREERPNDRFVLFPTERVTQRPGVVSREQQVEQALRAVPDTAQKVSEPAPEALTVTELLDERLDALSTTRQPLAEGFTDLDRFFLQRAEEVHRALEEVGEVRVDPRHQIRADTAKRRKRVLERPRQGPAHLLRDRARSLLRSSRERLEVDLALTGELENLTSRDTHLVGQGLVDRDTTVRELRDDVVLHTVRLCGCLVEDSAHLFHGDTGGRGGVRHVRQVPGELLARLDPGGDCGRGDSGGLTQSERGAADGGKGVVHDLPNGVGVVAEAAHLCLGVLDRLEPTKALDQGGASDRSDRPSGDHGAALAPRGEPVTEGPTCALAGLRTDVLAHALQLAPDLLL